MHTKIYEQLELFRIAFFKNTSTNIGVIWQIQITEYFFLSPKIHFSIFKDTYLLVHFLTTCKRVLEIVLILYNIASV